MIQKSIAPIVENSDLIAQEIPIGSTL